MVYCIDYKIILKQDYISESHTPALYYGKDIPESIMVSIPEFGLLNQTDVQNFSEKIVNHAKELTLFPVPGSERYSLTYDLFSLVFYFLSRYEEYLSFTPDSLGRFPAKQSLAWKDGFLKIPLVDIKINQLILLINNTYGLSFQGKNSKYRYQPTIDIDQVWAYSHKGFRNYLGLFRDLLEGNVSEVKKRMVAWKDTSKDPFNSYDLMQILHSKYKLEPIYFILIAQKLSPLDKNHNPTNRFFRKKIVEISKDNLLGIHPSARSGSDKSLLNQEINLLQEICSKPIIDSRQHFILMKFPETYRDLIHCGIKNDYSMGYPDQLGYRASTGHSFYWYDLLNDRQTDLLVTPFQIMDVTLKNYLKLAPKDACHEINVILNTAKDADSPVYSVWHNSSFDEKGLWDGWTEVYDHLLTKSQQLIE